MDEDLQLESDDSDSSFSESELEERKDLKEFIVLQSRIVFVQRFEAGVKDFASLFLDQRFKRSDNEDVVKTAYTKFFVNPSSDQLSMSRTIRRQILSIPEIDSIDEAIDLFASYYVSCQRLEDFELLDSLYKKKDITSLKLLLRDAPPPRNFHENLRRVLAGPILEALDQGRIP